MVRARGLASELAGIVLPLLSGFAVMRAGFGLVRLVGPPSRLPGVALERQAVFGLWGFARDGA